jgi:glucosamine--fructose-6-phosphate aminotransferase (isomerizing)
MLKEIMEQPETIQKAYNYGGRINNNRIKLGGLDRLLNNINAIDFIYLIGCGTSFNASILGEIYFNEINYFVNVKIVNACEFTIIPPFDEYSSIVKLILAFIAVLFK